MIEISLGDLVRIFDLLYWLIAKNVDPSYNELGLVSME